MIDKIIDVIESEIAYEMGKNSPYYTDHFIGDTTNKALTSVSPNGTVAVLEDYSNPTEYVIASRISPVEEDYHIKIQIIYRGMDEEKVKTERRIGVKRLILSLYRPDGVILTNILGMVDSGVSYRETVQSYKRNSVTYANSVVRQQFYYGAEISLTVKTDTNFNI